MTMMGWIVVVLLMVVGDARTDEDAAIRHQLSVLKSGQYERDTSYWPLFTFPPFEWATHAGIYASDVKIHLGGDHRGTNRFAIPDSNAFVSLFVAQLFGELSELADGALIPDPDTTLVKSIKGIAGFRDLNLGNGYSFWPQEKISVGGEVSYRAWPPNLSCPLDLLKRGSMTIAQICDHFGISRVKLDEVAFVVDVMNRVFGIPPDADDTGAALSLGALLHRRRSHLPLSYHQWTDLTQTMDLNRTINALIESAYRPFHNSEDYTDVIDPRTYYWMHDWIETEHDAGRDPFLITTWLQNINTARTWVPRFVAMPYAVNNVDASVVADALHGLLSSLLSIEGTEILFTEPVIALLLSSTRLIEYVIENNLVHRYQAIVLLYYPSKYTFYWFVSRIIQLVRDQLPAYKSPPAFLMDIYDRLGRVMSGEGTRQIMSSVITSSTDSFAIWEDFLTPDDRLFSTALAVNTLINIWTKRVGNGAHSSFIATTPASVIAALPLAITFLATKSAHLPLSNGFFSGSVKGSIDPTHFPVNFLRRINGTYYPCSPDIYTMDGDWFSISIGVRGVMNATEFSRQVAHPCATSDSVPTSFQLDSLPFAYWSSPSLTSILIISALLRYRNIQ